MEIYNLKYLTPQTAQAVNRFFLYCLSSDGGQAMPKDMWATHKIDNWRALTGTIQNLN